MEPTNTEGLLYYTILYKELEHLQILVSAGGPGTNTPWILRDNYAGIPHFIVLRRYCVFHKSKVCSNSASSKSIGAIFPIAFAHFMSLSHFGNSRNISKYFLAVLGLCCCTWALSSCSEQGLLFMAVHGLLIAVASLAAEHGL